MYGAPTWKRHIAWSNAPTVRLLDKGTLTQKHRKLISKFGVKSANTYTNKQGKKSFAGSKALKSTQSLGCTILAVHVCAVVCRVWEVCYRVRHASRHAMAISVRARELRTYPPAFAQRVVRLYNRFITKRPLFFGAPLESEEMDNFGIHMFASLPWDTADWWADCNLDSVFGYLRGSKDLLLGGLRPLFPTHY